METTNTTTVVPVHEPDHITILKSREPGHFYKFTFEASQLALIYPATGGTLIRIPHVSASSLFLHQTTIGRDADQPRSQQTVYIDTFAPEPYEVLKQIPVHLQTEADSVIATFFDANLSTAGETAEEAFSNLKSLILDAFDNLDSEPSKQLGPGPRRQLSVLRDFLRPA